MKPLPNMGDGGKVFTPLLACLNRLGCLLVSLDAPCDFSTLKLNAGHVPKHFPTPAALGVCLMCMLLRWLLAFPCCMRSEGPTGRARVGSRGYVPRHDNFHDCGWQQGLQSQVKLLQQPHLHDLLCNPGGVDDDIRV